MDKIKVLIADDHAVVREGTRQILEHEPDLDVVAEAVDGEEAVRLVNSSKPDVVIIGTGANGMMKVPNETIRFIKSFCEELVVEDTAAAVRIFNETSDARRTVGMFHLTC